MAISEQCQQCVVPRDYELCHVILRLDSCQDLVEF